MAGDTTVSGIVAAAKFDFDRCTDYVAGEATVLVGGLNWWVLSAGVGSGPMTEHAELAAVTSVPSRIAGLASQTRKRDPSVGRAWQAAVGAHVEVVVAAEECPESELLGAECNGK